MTSNGIIIDESVTDMVKTKAKKSAITGFESRLLFATVKVFTLLKDNPGIHKCLFVVDRPSHIFQTTDLL